MPTTLTDTRGLTVLDAQATLQELAMVEARLAKQTARYELRIATIKGQYEDSIAVDVAAQAGLRRHLDAAIMANQPAFQRPRKRRTEFGEFGLRAVSDVDVTDEEALIAHCREAGYADCVEDQTVVHKAAVRKRLDAGEALPGAAVRSGVRSTYRVAKALLDAARNDVRAG